MRIAGLDEAQAGLKIARRNINNLRYANDSMLMAESREELKSLLMKVKESENTGLKLNIQKTKIMESGPITSWQINGETVADFFWGAPKSLQMVTEAMKLNALSPWKESYDQPRRHIKKQRHYFANKFHLVMAMVFPVVMYGCESWNIKKTEHRRIDVFELSFWRRLLRVPWTARRSNQSILKISPEYSLEEMMLRLKFQYFGYLM